MGSDRLSSDCIVAAGESAIVTGAPLGRQLRVWRQLRRMKQSHVAELLCVSQTTISRWETGVEEPDTTRERALRDFMRATPNGAADFELARLVRLSSRPVHLICDMTHTLLALSAKRASESMARRPIMIVGRSLWRYATEEIVDTEARLPSLGWFDGDAVCLELSTGCNRSDEWAIEKSRFRIVRMRLSDGSYTRLVETLRG